MILVKQLKKSDVGYTDDIVRLHMKAFPGFFLTQLGRPFLTALYIGYLEDNESGIIVAEYGEAVVGFVAYSNDYPRFFKQLIKKHIIRFAWCSALAAIRHPSFAKRLFKAFKKSNSVVKNEKYVELASICVDPATENKGIGTKMIDYLKSIVDFDSFSYINLETDSYDNEEVNRFYIKNGFRLSDQYVTEEGRVMNEYRFVPETIK